MLCLQGIWYSMAACRLVGRGERGRMSNDLVCLTIRRLVNARWDRTKRLPYKTSALEGEGGRLAPEAPPEGQE